MLGGFGLGVPTVLTTVVAPAPVSAVSAAGYGAVVELITATRLPAERGRGQRARRVAASAPASTRVAAS